MLKLCGCKCNKKASKSFFDFLQQIVLNMSSAVLARYPKISDLTKIDFF